MKIEWLGHACFLLESSEGVRVLTDPFDPQIGYPAPAVPADIVTTSHQHSDHNHTSSVQGKFTVVDHPGETTVRGISIKGFPTFHDDAQGSKRGSNILFRFTIDGLNVLHCGDLGHPLSAEQVQAIGPVDVLIVPVGGYYTIDAPTAAGVMKQLHPALTIPMHFLTPAINYPIQTVDPFITAAGGGKKLNTTEIEVTPESLKKEGEVVVLAYPREG
jgi:L-ascorbate metabolism protein UlaG (beta-lactamase superfamily)